MYLRVLGSAAGGGYPQWNCACDLCRHARDSSQPNEARLHAALALSADGREWHLINATPDVLAQINSSAALHPGPNVRQTPIRSILLTDAELDHTIGLLMLREGAVLDIYATATVIEALSSSFPVKKMLVDYASHRWHSIVAGQLFALGDTGLSIEPINVGRRHPRYVSDGSAGSDWVVSFRIEDSLTGGSIFYCPCIESWTPEIESAIERADLSFIDGTFWSEDEMQQLGTGKLSASEMGHIPLSGTNGSIAHLARFSDKRKILIHINNTNPILNANSQQCQVLRSHGIEIGSDGMELEI